MQSVNQNINRLLTSKQAAAMLGVSTKTLWEWVNRGVLPQVKIPGTRPKYDIEDIRLVISKYKSYNISVNLKE